MSNYLMRSLMFVPAHNEKLMSSASRSDADVLLLDLEDSVQPRSNKQLARDKIVEWVGRGLYKKHQVYPRINDRESGELLKDLMQLTISGVDGFMYPKSYTGQDVYFIDKLLDTIEYEKGFPQGTFKLIPLIETAAAVLNAQDICRSSKRVVAIAYGSEDFITDLEGIHDAEHQSLFTPRSMIAMAARANNVIPVDTVHVDVHNMEDLEHNLDISKKLGFEGMLVLHPKELEPVHRCYSPSAKEVDEASEMLRLAEEAEKDGKGVAIMKDKFIGPPMVATAKKTLKKHRLIETKNQHKEA